MVKVMRVILLLKLVAILRLSSYDSSSTKPAYSQISIVVLWGKVILVKSPLDTQGKLFLVNGGIIS